MEESEVQTESSVQGELHHDEQGFVPSFAPFDQPPLGHSRPHYFDQDHYGQDSFQPQDTYQQEAAFHRDSFPFQQQFELDNYR